MNSLPCLERIFLHRTIAKCFFFAKVHELKINEHLKGDFITRLDLDSSSRASTLFYLCLLREMIIIHEKEFENSPNSHTDTEQEILYYIMGFKNKKVKENIDKLRCLRGLENILDYLTIDRSDDLGFFRKCKVVDKNF